MCGLFAKLLFVVPLFLFFWVVFLAFLLLGHGHFIFIVLQIAVNICGMQNCYPFIIVIAVDHVIPILLVVVAVEPKNLWKEKAGGGRGREKASHKLRKICGSK